MASLRNEKRVVLGFSGGVDSTAACLMLQEKGFEVIGVFMDVFGDPTSDTVIDAQNRALELQIPFRRIDVQKCFSDAVIADFCASYRSGKTPNPCIVCNPRVKFRTLFDAAKEEGAAFVATGHYAQIGFDEVYGDTRIYTASCAEKDQSYMLWGLYSYPEEIRKRILFPLGSVASKEDVRAYTKERGIGNFAKKDSQDICFIPPAPKESGEAPYLRFLKSCGVASGEGTFVDASGKTLAPSKGYLNYTIGQRKGFGIGFGKPMFVTRLDATNNRVYLGEENELFHRTIAITGTRLPEKYFGKPITCTAKIRYRAKPAPCTVLCDETGRGTVAFDVPLRAATPGQSCVFYDGDTLLGGSLIEAILPEQEHSDTETDSNRTL